MYSGSLSFLIFFFGIMSSVLGLIPPSGYYFKFFANAGAKIWYSVNYKAKNIHHFIAKYEIMDTAIKRYQTLSNAIKRYEMLPCKNFSTASAFKAA